MKKEFAEKRIEKLKKEIRKHRHSYHVLDRPEITDAVFDSLKKELEKLEAEFPELITEDSPTQRVGGKPLDKFKKFEHPVPMLSFNDAFSEKEVKDWLLRLNNFLGKKIRKVSSWSGFYCELKIDGLAVELIYKNGILAKGSTRGNGQVGEEITQNLKTISAIPLKLSSFNRKYKVPDYLVVRGEVFLKRDEFERINEEREKRGEKLYANPRNVAAGSLRQLDPKITASRKLDFFAYDIAIGLNLDTHSEKHKIMKSFGLKVCEHNKEKDNLEKVFEFRDYWDKNRKKLNYEIDGIVVIVNNNKIFENLGFVGKAPRGAIAYKFSPEERTTKVKEIKIQVGRTGALTPIAVLEPVNVGGVNISHATLHNFDQIKKIDIREGDTVVVSRAGDVIPQVTNVIKDLRDGDEKKPKIPNKCPLCGFKIIKDGVIYKCSNSNCGARHKESLYHFVSKAAFNIDGLGPKIIDKFLDKGLISDVSDIFEIKTGDIEILDGFGKKSAENIIESINSSKKIRLDKFLYSLGILHIGEETGRILSYLITKTEKDIKNPVDILRYFNSVSLEDLEKVDGIGKIMAKSIKDWFSNKKNKEILEKLKKTGIKISLNKNKLGKLKNKSFVLTGSLEFLTRGRAKEIIINEGGHVSSSVSNDIDYIVVGDKPGSKLKKAKEKNIKILNEEKFLELLGD
jgi:DNA ligase (NAD+)